MSKTEESGETVAVEDWQKEAFALVKQRMEVVEDYPKPGGKIN